MKEIICLMLLMLCLSCSKEDNIESIDSSEQSKRYITITNGETELNLYPLGMIGQAPGEVSNVITIVSDTFSLPYCWSDNTSKYDTIKVDFTGKPYEITKNIIVTK